MEGIEIQETNTLLMALSAMTCPVLFRTSDIYFTLLAMPYGKWKPKRELMLCRREKRASASSVPPGQPPDVIASMNAGVAIGWAHLKLALLWPRSHLIERASPRHEPIVSGLSSGPSPYKQPTEWPRHRRLRSWMRRNSRMDRCKSQFCPAQDVEIYD